MSVLDNDGCCVWFSCLRLSLRFRGDFFHAGANGDETNQYIFSDQISLLSWLCLRLVFILYPASYPDPWSCPVLLRCDTRCFFLSSFRMRPEFYIPPFYIGCGCMFISSIFYTFLLLLSLVYCPCSALLLLSCLAAIFRSQFRRSPIRMSCMMNLSYIGCGRTWKTPWADGSPFRDGHSSSWVSFQTLNHDPSTS